MGRPAKGRLRSWWWCLNEDWSAVCRPCGYNWIDFTFITASMEHTKYMDEMLRPDGGWAWDFHFALLGVHLFVSNCYDYAHVEKEAK
jgi:hypothetical protein